MSKRERENIIPFTDDFMFSLVMRDVEICREFLELIIPQEQFGEIKIVSPENPIFAENAEAAVEGQEMADNALADDIFTRDITSEPQKSMKFAADMHGVRLDVYIKSDDAWAEIEMQTGSTGLALGKRSRYYQSNMDLDCLESGAGYEELKKSYVIFICTFDYFKVDEAVYYFQNWDYEKGLKLDDASYKIILNTRCSQEKVPEKLRPFFEYINSAENSGGSELVDKIEERVQKFSTDAWRRKQMTFEYYVKDKERIAYRSGVSEGEKLGLERGEKLGLERGAAHEKHEIAKNMKNKQIDLKTIFEITGLPMAEIEKL